MEMVRMVEVPRIIPTLLLLMDCHYQMLRCDFKKARDNDHIVAKYMQDHDDEYPSMEMLLMHKYYGKIKMFVYCQELPLSVRFIPFDDAAFASKLGSLIRSN